MNHALVVFALALGLASCSSGPEGTYQLDKEALKKATEAEVAKKGKDEQGFAKLAMAMIDAMEMTLDVKPGGKYEMKSSMPNPFKEGEKKEDVEAGDWKVEGDTITLKGKKDVKCKVGGGQIECAPEKPGEAGFVFKKK